MLGGARLLRARTGWRALKYMVLPFCEGLMQFGMWKCRICRKLACSPGQAHQAQLPLEWKGHLLVARYALACCISPIIPRPPLNPRLLLACACLLLGLSLFSPGRSPEAGSAAPKVALATHLSLQRPQPREQQAQWRAGWQRQLAASAVLLAGWLAGCVRVQPLTLDPFPPPGH